MQSRKIHLLYLLPFVDDLARLPHGTTIDDVQELAGFFIGRPVLMHELPTILQGIRTVSPLWLSTLKKETDTILKVLYPGNYKAACAWVVSMWSVNFDLYPLTVDQVARVEAHVYVAPPLKITLYMRLRRFLAWLKLSD